MAGTGLNAGPAFFLRCTISLYTLAKSISGQVGDTPLDLVLDTMKDALISIYEENDWSFQRGIVYSNWLCPGNVATNGSSTVTPYLNTVILDGAATASVNTYTATAGAVPLTTLQYRDPSYSIYNIVAAGLAGTVGYVNILDPGFGQIPGIYTVPVTDNAGFGSGGTIMVTVLSNGLISQQPIVLTPGSNYTQPVVTLVTSGVPATFQVFQNALLTLDRPWLEPTTGGGQNYMIYQAYFVAPVQYFLKFIEMRDTTRNTSIDFWSMTQAELARRDPQRTSFADPAFCVPAGIDTRPGTSTPNWPMFELWPEQLSYTPYSFSYRYLGPVPQTQMDFFSMVPPYPISEELVKWRTKELLYQFREAQADKTRERGSGSNWILLTQMAKSEYDRTLDKIQAIDANLNGELISRVQPGMRGLSDQPYANRTGSVNVGGYNDGD